MRNEFREIMSAENCNNTRSISASGGGAKVENCGNTSNNYTNNYTFVINIDMRGSSREKFTERLEQLREITEVLGLNICRSDNKWSSNERIVKLTTSSAECTP